ncbi:AfsR/SARP family transcriptional regulator [Plantactinospora mayteni]|nr:BTAD domain-containing putative transcriptional regulator [Plantactinospora mayteni]
MLTVLLVYAGRVVTVDTLSELLWEGRPPVTARKAIQVYASRLRRALTDVPEIALRGVGHGYRLDLPAEVVDLWRFRDDVRRSGVEPHAAVVLLDRALSLWRGPALADLAATAPGRRLGAALEEERLRACETRIDAVLSCGGHDRVVAESTRLLADHPLRERLRGQLMVALYRCGRRAEALQVFDEGRRLLADDRGVDPGPELQEIRAAILNGTVDNAATTDHRDAPLVVSQGLAAATVSGVPDAARRLSFAILGPFETRVDNELVALTGRQRSVLAILLLNANRVVGVGQIADALWGDSLPAAPEARIRGLIAGLRRATDGAAADDLIVTRQPGYLVRVAPGELDLDHFQHEVDHAGRAARDEQPAQAIDRYDGALALWRGGALDGVDGAFVNAHATRLEEQRLRVIEERAEAMLTVGRHAELVAELTRVVAEHPLREWSHAQLMLALYRSGRRGEALAVYRNLRTRLVEELGLEPAPRPQQLHARMLAGDSGLNWPEEPEPRPDPEPPDWVPARQLPADPGSFVGHRAELDELDAVAEGDQRMALVVGAAGAGKTALAVHWARRSAHRFPDGQLFVDMRGFHTGPRMSPTEALPLLLVALGLAAKQIPINLDAQTALYRSTLAGRRVLVILDNVADADQVRPLLPGEPGCLVLVTSRDRLSGLVAMDGARRITLNVLSVAEAVDVLAHAPGRQRIDAERNAAVELARLCGNLPLALRIAGARLADRPHLGIRVHVEELAARGPITQLRVDGDGTATVRGAFDLSYRALPPGAKRLFRLLSLVPAPAGLTATAAAALTGLPGFKVEPLTDALARFHLVNVTADGRLICHDLLLEYAAQLAAGSDQPAELGTAIHRLLHFYLHTADRAATALLGQSRLRLQRDPLPEGTTPLEFAEQIHARKWIAAEWANLVAALDYAAESGRHRMVWHLANALRDFMPMQAPPTQGLHISETGLAAAQQAGDVLGEAAMWHNLGYLRWRTADYQAILNECGPAAALAERARWPQGQSAALINTGVALAQLGQTRQAIRRFGQALAIDRKLGDRIGEGSILINLTAAYEQTGDLSKAARSAELALPLLRETGQHQGQATAIENLAMVRREQGRIGDALRALDQSLTISRTIGARHEEASALTTLGLVHRDAGRHDDAIKALTTSLDITQRIADVRLESFTHNGLASVQIRLGHLDDAARSLGIALDITDRIGHHRGNVEALLTLSELHTAQDDHRRAHEQATRALGLAHTSGYLLLVARAHARLAAASLGTEDVAESLEHCRHALTTQRRAGQRLAYARTLLTMGHAYHRLGRPHLAQSRWRQAHTHFDEIGAPERDDTAGLLK